MVDGDAVALIGICPLTLMVNTVLAVQPPALVPVMV